MKKRTELPQVLPAVGMYIQICPRRHKKYKLIGKIIKDFSRKTIFSGDKLLYKFAVQNVNDEYDIFMIDENYVCTECTNKKNLHFIPIDINT